MQLKIKIYPSKTFFMHLKFFYVFKILYATLFTYKIFRIFIRILLFNFKFRLNIIPDTT